MKRFFSWASLGLVGLLSAGNLLRVESPIRPPKPEEPVDTSTLAQDAANLNKAHAYDVSAQDLAYLTRVVYFEGVSDRRAQTSADLTKGYDAIASVLLNRYEFDARHGTNRFGGEDGLIGVAKKNYAFSCIKDRPEFFEQSSFKNANSIALTRGNMNAERADAIYESLRGVLAHEKDDPTNGATYYKTGAVKDQWEGTEAFRAGGHSCKRRFTKRINSHEFFKVDCD